MAQRLPNVGSDDGNWGSILNGFLLVAHNADGTLLGSAVSTAGAEMTTNKDTDGTLTANSDTKYASQKAVKTYVDTGLAAKANDSNVVHKTGVETIGGAKTVSDVFTASSTITSGDAIKADFGSSIGNIKMGMFGAYPMFSVTNQNDLNAQIALATSQLSTTFGAPGASMWFGPGGSTFVDSFISRTADGGIATSGAVLPVNAQTGTTYTFVKLDAGKLVTSSNVATQTHTIPTNASLAFPIGSMLTITQIGTGALTVKGDTGVTVNGVSAGSISTTQYSTVLARKTATDTWIAWTQGVNGGMVVDTDGTLAANSDSKVASQKATKTYVDTNTQPNALGGTQVRLKGLDSWYAKLSDAQTTGVKVVVIGDSIASLGGGAWPWLLTQGMAIYGNAYSPDQSYYFAAPSTYSKDLGATVGTANGNGVAGWANTLTVGQAITKTMSCIAVTVVYTKQSGGGTIVVTDGVTTQNITTSAGSTSYSNLTTVTFPAYGSRTVSFTASGGSVVLEGAYIHADATTGVQIWNASHSGYSTDDFVSSSTNGDPTSHGLALIQNLVPDLVIIATTFNDAGLTYSARAQQLINNIRLVGPIPILLVTPWDKKDRAAVARTLVSANTQIATVDMYTPLGNVWQSPYNDPFNLSIDGAHPNPEGQALQADIVQAAITGDPIGTALTTQMRGYGRTITGGGATINTGVGTVSMGNYFSPFIMVKNGSGTNVDAQPQIAFTTGVLAAAYGAGPGMFLGPGGATIVDSWVSRTADGGIATSGAVLPVNAQTGTSYTFTKIDAGKIVTSTNAAAQTFTIPANATTAFPIGSVITVTQAGAGALTVTGAAGVTVNGTVAGSLSTTQYSTILARKTATDTWIAWTQGVNGGMVVDTDGTLAANSDSKVASQKATKTYVDVSTTTNIDGGVAQRSNNLNGWFTKYKAVVKGTGTAKVLVIGDSISSLYGINSWPGLLHGLFQSHRITKGLEGEILGSRFPSTGGGGTNAQATTIVGTASQDGAGAQSSVITSGQEFTQTFTGDAISIIYSKSATGGTINVYDGPSSGSVIGTASASGSTSYSNILDVPLPGGVSTRTVTIKVSGGSGTLIEQVVPHCGTLSQGVDLRTAARFGYNTANYLPTGATGATTNSESHALSLINTWQPDLIINALGQNDTSQSSWAGYTQVLYDKIMTYAPNANILTVLMYSTSGTPLRGGWIDNANTIAATYPGKIDTVSLPLSFGNLDKLINQYGSKLTADAGIHPTPLTNQMMMLPIAGKLMGDPYAVTTYLPALITQSNLPYSGNITGNLTGNTTGIHAGKFFQNTTELTASRDLTTDDLGQILVYKGGTDITVNVPIALGLSLYNGTTKLKQLGTGKIFITVGAGLTYNGPPSTLVPGQILALQVPVTTATVVFGTLYGGSAGIDTDTTLTANSDTKVASQKATKTYIDTVSQPYNFGALSQHPLEDGWKTWQSTMNQVMNGTKAANIVVIGDSWATLGARNNSYPYRLAQYLSRYKENASGDGGTFVPTLLTNTGTTIASGGLGASLQGSLIMVAGSTSTTPALTNVSTVTVVAGVPTGYTGGTIKVYKGDVATGTLLQSIDMTGVAAGTYSNVYNVPVTGTLSANTVYTLQFVGGTGTLFELLQLRQGSEISGVEVFVCAQAGSFTALFTPTSYAGSATSNGPSSSHALNLIANLNPDMVIIGTCTNDNPATYSNDLTAMVAELRTLGVPTVMVLSATDTSGSNWATISAKTAAASSIVAANKDICHFFSWRPMLGNIQTNATFKWAAGDGLHPTNAFDSMGAQIAADVSGDPLGTTLAYIANITTGTVGGTYKGSISNDVGVNGKISFGQVLFWAGLTIADNGADTNQSVLLGGSALMTLLGLGPNGGIGLGGGGANVMDTALSRSAAGEITAYTTVGGANSKANIVTADPVNDNQVATKKYVDVYNINNQTGASYTLLLSDSGKQVTRSNATASTQTLPSDATAALAVGVNIPIVNIGAGVVTFAAGAGATIQGVASLAQWQAAMMTKIASNTWVIAGGAPTGGSTGPRVNTITPVSNVYTIDPSTTDLAIIVSPAANFTVTTTGSPLPADGQKLQIRIQNGATGYIPTWNSVFASSGLVTLPSVAYPNSKTNVHGFTFDAAKVNWVLMALDPTGY